MPNNIKAVQLMQCPHCTKDFYVYSTLAMDAHDPISKEETDEVKRTLIKRVEEGDLPNKLSDERKLKAIEWLKNPENVLFPFDVEPFLKEL
jgi:hypothetical protein